jgi:hypothetical protein
MASSTQTNYEVKMSPRGFDVRSVASDQAVYFSHSRVAARLVNEALSEGRIEAREAVALPVGVTDVRAALDAAGQARADKVADLNRIIDDLEMALHPEYGFNNDELLRLGIGYGIPGPLSDEQVRREAAEVLSELEAASDGPWRPAVNGARRRPWFLIRDAEQVSERYYFGGNGRLVRYASCANAERAADRLNKQAGK